MSTGYTVCPRSLVHFHIVIHNWKKPKRDKKKFLVGSGTVIRKVSDPLYMKKSDLKPVHIFKQVKDEF